MDLEKIYHNIDDNECNILQLVKKEPEWAANKIQEGEKAIKILDNIRTETEDETWTNAR